jgi:hypothetical protein
MSGKTNIQQAAEQAKTDILNILKQNNITLDSSTLYLSHDDTFWTNEKVMQKQFPATMYLLDSYMSPYYKDELHFEDLIYALLFYLMSPPDVKTCSICNYPKVLTYPHPKCTCTQPNICFKCNLSWYAELQSQRIKSGNKQPRITCGFCRQENASQPIVEAIDNFGYAREYFTKNIPDILNKFHTLYVSSDTVTIPQVKQITDRVQLVIAPASYFQLPETATGGRHSTPPMTLKKSTLQVTYQGRKRRVYLGPRGGKYLRIKGQYVSLRKLKTCTLPQRPSPQAGGGAAGCARKGKKNLTH